MCEVCKSVVLWKNFYSPRDYFNCLNYLQELIDGGGFEMESGTCDLDKVQTPDGK